MRRIRPGWPLTALLLAAACLDVTAAASGGPSVNVELQAAFPSPPYLIELLETAALENATSYLPLLDRIASGYFADRTTDKSLYEGFLEVLQQDGHMASPETLSTFKLAVAMRRAAPRIEAHYQFFETAVEPLLDGSDETCAEWAVLDDKRYCSPALDSATGQLRTGSMHARVLPFDRELGTTPAAPAVVLYADVASPSFGAFHRELASRALKGEISYRVRYKRPAGEPREPLPVAGYGVELALKKTDYIVIDDRDSAGGDSSKEGDTAAAAGRGAASEGSDAETVLAGEDEDVADLKPLSTSELTELGLKASSFIMQSERPFETLLKLTQDFPKYSSQIAAHRVSEAFVTEHTGNRLLLAPSGVNVLWANGLQLIERQIEAFTLVDILRRERRLIQGVRELGLTGREAVSLLGHKDVTQAKADDNESPRFDWRDELEEGKVILWLNDLEKDERYAEWPTSLFALLQRTYPGQIPPIRRDIFNLIVPVDFANESDVSLVRDQLTSFVDRGITVRFGIVPLTQTRTAEGSTDQAKVVYHLAEKYGLQTMLGYLQSCLTAKKTARPDKEIFNDIVRDATLNMDDVSEEAPAVPTLEEVLTSEESKKRVALFRHWTKRMNADTEVPPAFIDGVAVPRNDNWLHAMSLQLATDLQLVQQAVFGGAIPTEEDSDDYFWIPSLFLERASQRRNPYIVPEDGKAPPVLDVHRLYADNAALLLSGAVPVIEASPDASSESWAALTVVADADSEPGQALLVAALRFRNNNPGVRLDIVHNPAVADGAHKVNSRLLAVSHEKLLEVDTVAELQTLLASSPAPPESDDGRYAAALTSFLASASLTPGARAVILNGRVVGHIAASDALGDDDLQHLLEFERAARILPVHGAAQQLGLADRALRDPLSAAKLTSVTALSTVSDLPEGIFESAPTLRMAGIFDQWNSTHTAFEVGDRDQASVHLVALLNPASEQGQRWAPILKVLSELDGVYLKVFLNPREQLDELPVKRFFRYVLESAPSFDAEGRVKRLRAHFAGLPREALLTAGMNTPPAWLVAAKKSVHDLDNIKLSSVAKGTNVDAVYELENILIEGHSRDEDRQAPRGAQLVLTTATEQQGRPPLADTIIMANLGYFQFKANPGVYRIDMKPGRSADIYHIESVGAKGYGPVPGDEGTEVALIDFQGATLYPRIRHKPGMEKENVLEPAATADKDKDKEGSILSKGLKLAEGLFGGGGGSAVPAKTKTSTSDEEHAEINIFSVASGHLYERMLNIMMVSVMKHTNHTVKFWFIEQFLSPSFKDFIPHLAAEYGFRYEMVTFKWPHWLRQQKEKQREIWGYKILFLDVLFPLSLDKVIFVDADQIVRTDMKELVDLDLEGAPYGFTPMCDSRTEMEGFRFWKTGYWKNYLKGLPYHISALYVVDLRRFRAMAAGDRLRQQYHSLSADPNSLANLDQDLPNHMQIVIPIKSLPQEWLWCETWCDDESLATARTIDLCNNPLTKEPKLDRARRQVPEWTVYDEEIAALDRRRREKKAVGTGDGGQKVLKEERAQSSSSSSSSSSAEQAKTRIKDEL